MALPQKIRVDVFAHFFIRLKQKSIICSECQGLSQIQLRKKIMSDTSFLRSLSTENKIPHPWFKRYNQTVKSIIINHHKLHKLQNENDQLEKNQLSPHDNIESFQRIKINWDSEKQVSAYLMKIEESVEKYCKCNDSPNQKGKSPKH